MPLTLEALESEVLRLSTADRTRLLDRVVASLDADAEKDAAWDAVAGQRDAELGGDPSNAASVDEVLAQLRAELG